MNWYYLRAEQACIYLFPADREACSALQNDLRWLHLQSLLILSLKKTSCSHSAACQIPNAYWVILKCFCTSSSLPDVLKSIKCVLALFYSCTSLGSKDYGLQDWVFKKKCVCNIWQLLRNYEEIFTSCCNSVKLLVNERQNGESQSRSESYLKYRLDHQ